MNNDTTISDAIIYVVDDDASIRKAMIWLFESRGFQVLAFESAKEFLEHNRSDVPACLILDLQMPDQTGIELQESLATDDADLPIVFMTAHADIPTSVKAIRGGAIDFLEKPVADDQLLETVQQAIQRHTLQRQDATELVEFRRRVKSLSKREREVMNLVVEGRLNKQIASRLGIVEYTVKIHRRRVMEKTGVDSLAELVRLHERSGIALRDT